MKSLFSISIFIFVLFTTTGQNVNLSNGNVFDGEPYLAINPYNSRHLVIAWMGWVNFSNQIKIKVRTSFNGGLSWSEISELPHVVNGYTSADPSIVFNESGHIFICYIDFTGTTPPINGGVYLCKSEDGGLSWQEPKEVITTNFDGNKWPIDRPWMAIDRSDGPHMGNIYITTMNANRTEVPFNPYFSVSEDGGDTFKSRYLDTTGFLAGSINPLPMCSPTVNSAGVFLGAYPSLVFTQNLQPQIFLAKSINGGKSFVYSTIFRGNALGNYPLAKKAPLLISHPTNPNHLAYFYLSNTHGDLDVFFTESMDEGSSWSSPIRINDDPIGNNRMQDLLWADFNLNGDLVASWRDRRNGSDSTYNTQTQIWATFKRNGASNFAPNFRISSQTVEHDQVLENAGNDFMCIKLDEDTINAVWGDVRNGHLNIWFQKMKVDGTILSIQQLSKEKIPQLNIYPNPFVQMFNVEGNDIKSVSVFDLKGAVVYKVKNEKTSNLLQINLANFPAAAYWVKIETSNSTFTHKILKQ